MSYLSLSSAYDVQKHTQSTIYEQWRGARNFHLARGYGPGSLETEVPHKLRQFADIVYRFGLRKQSKFENFAQFTSRFLTSMFTMGAK